MSDQVTVNAAWLAEVQRENEAQLAEKDAEIEALRELVKQEAAFCRASGDVDRADYLLKELELGE
jgi:hypothetical protein